MAEDIVLTTLNSGFFDSESGDRVYSAEEMNNPYSALIGNGIFGNNGIPVADSENTGYRSSGMQVALTDNTEIRVSLGGGIINGHWFKLNTAVTQEFSGNYNLYERHDIVVVKYSESERKVTLEYREGTEAETDPSFDEENELKLARIIVPSNTSGGSPSVQDCRATTECPLVCGLIGGITRDTLWAELWEKGETLEDLVGEETEEADEYYSTDLSPYATLLKATQEVIPVGVLSEEEIAEIIV